MLKVELSQDSLFRIEKIIRRDNKLGRALVKWSGYPDIIFKIESVHMQKKKKKVAEPNEKLYLNLKEIYKVCHEKRIKNVKRKTLTKEQLLEELGIDPKKVAKPPRSTSIPVTLPYITFGVTTDYKSIYRCGKDLGISFRTIGRYLS